MTVQFLKDHLDNIKSVAKYTATRAAENKDDLLLNLAAVNQSEALNSIKSELLLAQAEEVGELLDLRFMGVRAEGSILLDSFIKIAEPLSLALKCAAQRLRYGSNDSQIKPEIADTLNIKLAGIKYGSTRILLTGNGRPDLTGSNLLHETLIQTFRVLNANNDDFYDAIDAIGGKAANHFGDAVKAIDNAGLGAEFTWNTPTNNFFWRGLPDDLVRIKALLDTIKEPEIYMETITGMVAGILDTGRLDLRTDEGKITIRYPMKLTESVQRLVISKPASIKVQTSKYWDAISKKDIFKRQMIELGELDLEQSN